MLERYHCSVPFHIVRTRFLGNIATPGQQVAPMDMLKALWGGKLPSFDSLDCKTACKCFQIPGVNSVQ